MTFIMLMFTFVRQKVVGGIETPVWIMVGMLAWFMFLRVGSQCTNAVNANHALFTYRQVKPVDTVLVRAGLEGFMLLMIAFVLLFGAYMFGLAIIPADPLAVLEAFFGMWLLGLGWGLVTSVATELVPEFGRVFSMSISPLYFVSGVIFPITRLVPPPFRDYLLFNPLLHGVEAARLAFAPHYQAIPELSIAYIYGFAVTCLFLGLALHYRFKYKLAAFK